MRSVCHGCGTPIPPSRRGRARKWCSERCRRQTCYGGTCEYCGSSTNGSKGPGTAARVCRECLKWPREAILDAIRRWAQQHGGIPPTSQEWQAAAADHPCANTVAKTCGGWNTALLAAGFALRCDRRPETQAWVEERFRAGIPVAEIARRLGVTPDAVYGRLRKRGLRSPRAARSAVGT